MLVIGLTIGLVALCWLLQTLTLPLLAVERRGWDAFPKRQWAQGRPWAGALLELIPFSIVAAFPVFFGVVGGWELARPSGLVVGIVVAALGGYGGLLLIGLLWVVTGIGLLVKQHDPRPRAHRWDWLNDIVDVAWPGRWFLIAGLIGIMIVAVVIDVYAFDARFAGKSLFLGALILRLVILYLRYGRDVRWYLAHQPNVRFQRHPADWSGDWQVSKQLRHVVWGW